MDILDEPKKEIYDVLKTLTGVNAYQIRPEILPENEMPIVTFYVSLNIPRYALDKGIGKQDIEVTIDIWAKNSKDTGSVLIELEDKMREIDYLMSGAIDIPDAEGYSHLSAKFVY